VGGENGPAARNCRNKARRDFPSSTSLFGPKLALRRVQSGRQMVSMQRPLLTATLSLTPAFSS
jgi:hypothetical protein